MPLQATSGAASYDAFGGGVAAVPTYIEDVFSTYLYTGTGAAQSIVNGIDESGEGALTWIKNRSTASEHALFDTNRGVNKALQTQSTAAEFSYAGMLTAFNSNGFSLGTDGVGFVNVSGDKYASWTFRKQPKFFDVVTYTGNGNNRQIAHNLGSVPGFIIIKRTDSTSDWTCYHRSLGNTTAIILNTTAASFTTFGSWDSTTPTSTEFTVGVNATVNSNGGTYVAYLFAHNAGGFGLTGTDNVISCGSFSGNTTVDLGYEPQWVLLKNATSADNWYLIDNMRGWPVQGNGSANTLYANSSVAEQTADTKGTPTATGFTTYGFGGSTGIYIAIRRGPMKVPTSGTSVFSPVARTGTGATATMTTGFVTDLSITKIRGQTYPNVWFDRLRGALQVLKSTSTDSEATSAGSLTGFDVMTGVTLGSDGSARINASGETYANWEFSRAPGFFDEVCYTGVGYGVRQDHNLTVRPQLIIIKNRSASQNWVTVWLSPDGTNSYNSLSLNTTSSFSNPDGDDLSYWVTPSNFYTGYLKNSSGQTPTDSGNNFVAYLFATCAGVSKVFSYTGNGSSQTINCGFTAGARWILIKRTDSTGDWYVWDSARGIVSGNDPHLSLNTTAAEVTTDDTIDTDSTGFVVNQVSATNVNVSSATYIGIAIA